MRYDSNGKVQDIDFRFVEGCDYMLIGYQFGTSFIEQPDSFKCMTSVQVQFMAQLLAFALDLGTSTQDDTEDFLTQDDMEDLLDANPFFYY